VRVERSSSDDGSCGLLPARVLFSPDGWPAGLAQSDTEATQSRVTSSLTVPPDAVCMTNPQVSRVGASQEFSRFKTVRVGLTSTVGCCEMAVRED